MPDPGDDLVSRVAGTPDRAFFYWSGRESVVELQRTLSVVGRTVDSFDSILDFGCGCGRTLLWMEEIAKKSQLHGTDIDAEAIEWCRSNLLYVQFEVNAADPPLPYPDNAFDLVVNHSVFTHIDEDRQDRWLSELHRVSRPGAYLVLSVHGERALPDRSRKLRDRLEQYGIVFVDGSMPDDFALPDWYQNTWHAPWYVFEHWGRWFDIRAYLPGAALGLQDHVLVERLADSAEERVLSPLAARPIVPAVGTPADRTTDALNAARAYRSGAAGSARSGLPRRLARRLLLRLMRPYTAHEDDFDDAVATSIVELTRANDHQASLLDELKARSDPR
jgi:SAM-dependent methyltransferase